MNSIVVIPSRTNKIKVAPKNVSNKWRRRQIESGGGVGRDKKIGKKAVFDYEALPHHCVFSTQFSEGNGDPKMLLWNNHKVFTPHFSTVINESIFLVCFYDWN